MYLEIKTDDQQLILRLFREQTDSGKLVRIALDKDADLYFMSVNTNTNEPESASLEQPMVADVGSRSN